MARLVVATDAIYDVIDEQEARPSGEADAAPDTD